MTLTADVFPKLLTPENVVTFKSKKFCFRGPFDKQHGKHAKTLLDDSETSERQHFYHIY